VSQPRSQQETSRAAAGETVNQAEFVCSSCGFTCNADENSANNVAAGQDIRPALAQQRERAGGVTAATSRSSTREPQPTRVGIPLF
jgi:transposase